MENSEKPSVFTNEGRSFARREDGLVVERYHLLPDGDIYWHCSYEYDENGYYLGGWCRKQRKRFEKKTLESEKNEKLKLICFRFNNKKENELEKNNLCYSYGIEYSKHKILKNIPYSEIYAKIMFLIDNNLQIEQNGELHEIFTMSNENMIIKYAISKEEILMKYYIERKGKKI